MYNVYPIPSMYGIFTYRYHKNQSLLGAGAFQIARVGTPQLSINELPRNYHTEKPPISPKPRDRKDERSPKKCFVYPYTVGMYNPWQISIVGTCLYWYIFSLKIRYFMICRSVTSVGGIVHPTHNNRWLN